MKNLLASISEKVTVDLELQQQLELCFERIEAKQGEQILVAGNRANYLYFVEQGMLHNYYYQDRRKVTSWFYNEYQFVTAWHSFYTQKPSYEGIECLEDCVLYRISRSDYKKLINDSPAFNNFARLLAEEAFAFLDEFSKGWSFLSAKDKYHLLKEYLPDLELRVKLGAIASFLGITQETLSRIRAEK